MYQIFESPVYFRQFILEAEPTLTKVEKTQTISNDKDLNTTLTTDKIESSKPVTPTLKAIKPKTPTSVSLPPEEDTTFPEDNFDTTGEEVGEPEVTEKDKYQAIQKFILYHKLRELQYKLDNLSTINSYKDKESLIKFTKFLSYVITFFSVFDYKQASKLSERILEEFKKIK